VMDLHTLLILVVNGGKHQYSSHDWSDPPLSLEIINKKVVRVSFTLLGMRTRGVWNTSISANCLHNMDLPLCQGCHARKQKLKRHWFKCTYCDYSTHYIMKLQRHIRTHHTCERPFTCDQCHQRFIYKRNLKRHNISIHRGEKALSCEECGLRFRDKHESTQHLLCVHQKLRPFVCEHCQRTFTRRYNLQKHVSAIHLG
jgi:hypothetical protein